ncbi:MAG: pyridoxal-phosphate dependent enzyme [Armatimonadetes bacterium]|nr:pyridoxal-phosphate dependent enzyme [Armatimonadota bacterium]
MNHLHPYANILQTVGQTPMVRLNKMAEGLPCEIFAKCEYFNPGGSVKDRIAVRMIEQAEKSGRIKPGDTLIEATSGNTGIGLAMAAAVKGYRLIICMPMKMSMEKQNILEALGAKIIRTRTEARFDEPDSLFGIARKLQAKIPNSHILDQYANPDNIQAHYDGTGEEIVAQMGGRLDYFVGGVGTGGTITGIARKLKEKVPNCKIVGADPEGSILSGGEPGPSYKVEGIGYDFFPESFDPKCIDMWVRTNDKVSFDLAMRLIREEGLLCGGSSGSAMQAVYEVAKKCKGGERIVVLIPDSIRNYMSKHLSREWREANGMLTHLDMNPEHWDIPAL